MLCATESRAKGRPCRPYVRELGTLLLAQARFKYAFREMSTQEVHIHSID